MGTQLGTKPDFVGLGAEIIPVINNSGMYSGSPPLLFDDILDPAYPSQTIYLYGTSHFIDFTVDVRWSLYCFSNNSYPGYFPRLDLFIWNGTDFVKSSYECIWTKGNNTNAEGNTWFKFFDKIPAGRYKVSPATTDTYPYMISGEWYFERVAKYTTEPQQILFPPTVIQSPIKSLSITDSVGETVTTKIVENMVDAGALGTKKIWTKSINKHALKVEVI